MIWLGGLCFKKQGWISLVFSYCAFWGLILEDRPSRFLGG